ncbi:HAD-IA family hydrolase [Kushneria aurantia]|uniref:HAD-IA family hydrolase n=1 Tax=Kushneria aurantia TaxID=504092 RepID=A0ABV6G434_9GAMM|nr:HAD-IA family hydrolase [Kushneria aurantia]
MSLTPAPVALLFDLDGTLVDTAPDLAGAANALRARHDLPPLPYEPLRREVSEGAGALVTLALRREATHPDFDAAREQLLSLYGEAVAVSSALFEGLREVLDHYRDARRPWGIVTNKPRRFAVALLEALQIEADVLLCADDMAVKKPDPAPLLEAARQLSVAPGRCWYIGDHRRDVEAARAAGMTAIAVRYGYLREGDDPGRWGADRVVETPTALAALLLQKNG